MARAEDWTAARAEAASLQEQADLRAAAEAYVKTWPKHPPNSFSFTSRQRRAAVRKAFGDGSGWASRLVMSCPDLTHYILNYRDLGLTKAEADPANLYDLPTLKRVKSKIRTLFKGKPHRWKIEAGNRIHAHVLADSSACPEFLRLGSARARPCNSYLEQVVGYLCKPPAPYTAESVSIDWEARRKLPRLPQLSGIGYIPKNLPAAELNDLHKLQHFQHLESDSEPTSQDALSAPVRLAVPCLKSAPPNRPRRGRKLLRTRARAPPPPLLSRHPL